MSYIEAILLGIIQGLTEFLPISSTGHLTVVGKLLGLISEENPERWTAFIAIVQIGTLVAILTYFYKDIINIITDFFRDNLFDRKGFKAQSENSKLGWYIILGTIPVVIIGLGFKDVIEGALTKNLYLIASSLIALGIILSLAEMVGKFKKDLKEITWLDSLLIGIAQSFALIPGSSRSGTTITAGLFLGLKRETAARFSFLLSVPAIAGSGLLELFEALEYIDADGILKLIIATITAAISGYLTIEFLLRFLKKHSTLVFVFYRIAIGLIIIGLLQFGIITA